MAAILRSFVPTWHGSICAGCSNCECAGGLVSSRMSRRRGGGHAVWCCSRGAGADRLVYCGSLVQREDRARELRVDVGGVARCMRCLLLLRRCALDCSRCIDRWAESRGRWGRNGFLRSTCWIMLIVLSQHRLHCRLDDLFSPHASSGPSSFAASCSHQVSDLALACAQELVKQRADGVSLPCGKPLAGGELSAEASRQTHCVSDWIGGARFRLTTSCRTVSSLPLPRVLSRLTCSSSASRLMLLAPRSVAIAATTAAALPAAADGRRKRRVSCELRGKQRHRT